MVEINLAYCDERTLMEAAEHFKREGSMQLLEFLTPKALEKFQNMKWRHVYVPMKYSYRFVAAPKIPWFSDFVSHIIGGPINVKLSCLSFAHGDYSVLYDSLKPGKGYAIMLDINDFPESWGGYTVFMKGSKEVVRVVPKRNSLTIVNQNNLKSFHKYVNHHAKYPRIFLYGIAVPK